MINAPRLCRKCGAEIPSDAPEGGCLGCLLQAGFGVLPETLVAARDATVTSTKADQGGSAENFEANLRLLLARAKNQQDLPRCWGTRRLRVTGSGRQGRSGRGISRLAKESQSHSGTQDD